VPDLPARVVSPPRKQGVSQGQDDARRRKSGAIYARLAPLLREHIEAGRSVNSFVLAEGTSHRVVAAAAEAHGVTLPPKGTYTKGPSEQNNRATAARAWHRERRALTGPGVQMRPCMCCKQPLRSEGSHHRLCDPCKRSR
jgi:hypothetical protein